MKLYMQLNSLKLRLPLHIRYQRQNAIFVMREVNKFYGLPNPPSWYQKLFKSTMAAIVKLANEVIYYKREPIRVS